MKLVPARSDQALIARSVSSASPVEETSQLHGFGVSGLDADRGGDIKGYEALVAIAIDKGCRGNAFIDMGALDPFTWEVTIVHLSSALKGMAWAMRLAKVSGIRWDAEKNLVAGEAVVDDIVDASLARAAESRTSVVFTRGKKLRVVATDVGPCTGEVVSHEVEKVEQLAHSGQVEMPKAVLAHGEGTGQEVIGCRESLSNGLKEQKIIQSRLRSLRMFPVDCFKDVGLSTCT